MKNSPKFICILFLLLLSLKGSAQDSLAFKGQLSVYTHLNSQNELPWWSGGRYIPQLNYQYKLSDKRLIDFEASANLYGNVGLSPIDSSYASGSLKPYRLWARYSTHQFELRAGLQKINFGSASILRPLMWFDQIDPRDPLKLTDGVWGVLARYYFLNNANLWLWGLYGNDHLKGWESFTTKKNVPEFGGRLQLPVPKGETGFSYHHRSVNLNSDSMAMIGNVQENRFGFDAKFDMKIGWWVEASWSNFTKNIGIFTNQEIMNLGMDYTFGIGNGLALTYEQLFASLDKDPFGFKNATTFSLINLSYPLGIFSNISAMTYYDWTNNKTYNFLNLQRQYNKFTFYLIGYINPKEYKLPAQGTNNNLYAGSGLQLMAVFNY